MQRNELLERIRANKLWDVIVIGGGATGLGTAVDAASRGYTTLLLEAFDFAKGTSSRSTKLVHGGVRYLKQGNIALVREGLHERGLLLRHAPTLEPKGLWAGVMYYDGQFDDTRLAITLLRTLLDLGGTAINYLPAIGLRKQ